MAVAVEEAARCLIEAQRNNRPIERLPEALRPHTVDAAYAIQDAVAKATGAVGGWKVGGPLGAEGAYCGLVFRHEIRSSGTTIEAAGLHQPSLEIEFGFRIRADLSNAADLTDEAITAALDFIPLMEVLNNRYVDPAPLPLPEKLADRQGNGGFVIGQPVIDWRELDFSSVRAELSIDGKIVQSAMGTHPLGNPTPLVVWQARHCAGRGTPLKAGDIVTTGSLQGASPIAAGSHAVATWGRWGRVEVRFE